MSLIDDALKRQDEIRRGIESAQTISGRFRVLKTDRMTVIDLIDCTVRGLYPVGRLDRDTEGLLLITNDGPLAHELLSPKKHVDKEYFVQTEKIITEDDLNCLRKGVWIDGDNVCRPADVIPCGEKACHLIIREGKFHQVKRMFEALGNQVVYLKRLRMKNLVLDPALKPGEYRPLTREELEDLRSAGI